MFDLSLPWWEFIARALIVYVAALILIRLSGKRTIGEFSPFDVLVLLLLAEAAQGSLTGNDESVPGGLIVIAALIALNMLVAFITTRSRAAERVITGQPVILIKDGELDRDALLRNNIPEGELDEVMHSAKIRERADVDLAILETSGDISFFKKSRQ